MRLISMAQQKMPITAAELARTSNMPLPQPTMDGLFPNPHPPTVPLMWVPTKEVGQLGFSSLYGPAIFSVKGACNPTRLCMNYSGEGSI